METATILIVDPDPKFRSWSKAVLRAEGFRTASVSGGLEALALCACRQVNLVLLGLELTRISAEVLVRTLHDRFPALPIVGLAADPATPRPAGLLEVLRKPLEPAELTACARRALASPPKKEPAIEKSGEKRRAGAGGF